ncbi:unnamed protein product, partial [Prorocentrum cordatum]
PFWLESFSAQAVQRRPLLAAPPSRIPRGPAMARSASLLLTCAAAAAAALLVSSLALSFVGASPAGLRAGQRAPSVEMQFFGGAPVTTTPPPPAGLSLGDVGGNNYVISMTILFFGSVLANANGFFAPW